MHANGNMIVRYYIGDNEYEPLRNVYTGKRDFAKRCTTFNKQDTESTLGGDVTYNIWDMFFDFVHDGKPLFIFPVAFAAQYKVTKMTLEVEDNVPYKQEDGQTPAQMAYTRFPNILIYEAPTI